MRYIDKSGPVPDCLQKFIDDSQVDGQPMNLHYNNFRDKAELTDVLTAEQFGLCGYTGQYMTTKNRHIEHVKPQSICRDEVRDAGRIVGRELCCDLHYNNIIAAVEIKGKKPNGAPENSEAEDNNGASESDEGQDNNVKNAPCKKKKLYGATARTPKKPLPVTPLQPNCGTRFLYTQAGEVIPAKKDDQEAKTTINELCLNEETLLNLRIGRLKPFTADDFLLTATEEELRQIVVNCNTVEENGWLPEFAFVIQSVIESVLP